jgi:hypothetical protein
MTLAMKPRPSDNGMARMHPPGEDNNIGADLSDKDCPTSQDLENSPFFAQIAEYVKQPWKSQHELDSESAMLEQRRIHLKRQFDTETDVGKHLHRLRIEKFVRPLLQRLEREIYNGIPQTQWAAEIIGELADLKFQGDRDYETLNIFYNRELNNWYKANGLKEEGTA